MLLALRRAFDTEAYSELLVRFRELGLWLLNDRSWLVELNGARRKIVVRLEVDYRTSGQWQDRLLVVLADYDLVVFRFSVDYRPPVERLLLDQFDRPLPPQLARATIELELECDS